ncbi:29757_t:CDS:2, partial [Gigaspora margarita]
SLPLRQQSYSTTQQLYLTTQQPYLTTQQPYLATQQLYSATQLYMDSLTLNEVSSKYNEVTLFLLQLFTTSRDQENLLPFGPIAINIEPSTSSTSSNFLGSVITSGKSLNQ